MSDEIRVSAERVKARVIKYPEFSEWQCLMFGGTDTDGWTWRPLKGGEPNWFWRKMQYLILGNKWVKDLTDASK
jgi:hypothetical protein